MEDKNRNEISEEYLKGWADGKRETEKVMIKKLKERFGEIKQEKINGNCWNGQLHLSIILEEINRKCGE